MEGILTFSVDCFPHVDQRWIRVKVRGELHHEGRGALRRVGRELLNAFPRPETVSMGITSSRSESSGEIPSWRIVMMKIGT